MVHSSFGYYHMFSIKIIGNLINNKSIVNSLVLLTKNVHLTSHKFTKHLGTFDSHIIRTLVHLCSQYILYNLFVTFVTLHTHTHKPPQSRTISWARIIMQTHKEYNICVVSIDAFRTSSRRGGK